MAARQEFWVASMFPEDHGSPPPGVYFVVNAASNRKLFARSGATHDESDVRIHSST